MSGSPTIRRGDVILAPIPFIQNPRQSKSRPVVVIQTDDTNEPRDQLIVAMISSIIPRLRYPTHYYVSAQSAIGNAAGLWLDSIVMTETIMTIPKNTVQRILGHFPADAMTAIDGCLKVSLAL